MKKLVIIGASGHGKVVADIALLNGYDEIVFLDDNPAVKTLGDFDVVGTSSEIPKFVEAGSDFFVAIGNSDIRHRIMDELELAGACVPLLIHPSAVVAYDAAIGAGSVVMAKAVVSEGVTVGKGCILNTGAVVGVDSKVADFAHVSVGAVVGSQCTIGAGDWIGIGAKAADEVTVCSGVVVGAGALIDENVNEAGVYVRKMFKKGN